MPMITARWVEFGFVIRGCGDAGALDVREHDAFEQGHISGARLLPRGQLELRVNEELTDPTRRILRRGVKQATR
jgi:rhodanese-related sulfurtransferase